MDYSTAFEGNSGQLASKGVARRLRGATLALFETSDDPARDRHWLCDPLSRTVASNKSRHGQALCTALAAALAAGDLDAALDACRQLVQLEFACRISAAPDSNDPEGQSGTV
jgi:hypothetical protein